LWFIKWLASCFCTGMDFLWGGTPKPHAAAQVDAWQRTISFLNKHLSWWFILPMYAVLIFSFNTLHSQDKCIIHERRILLERAWHTHIYACGQLHYHLLWIFSCNNFQPFFLFKIWNLGIISVTNLHKLFLFIYFFYIFLLLLETTCIIVHCWPLINRRYFWLIVNHVIYFSYYNIVGNESNDLLNCSNLAV
jgi:hypothetical protein